MFLRPVMLFIVAASLMLLLVSTVGAVSIRHIDAAVAVNGDTLIVADYTLDWIEQAIVYPAALTILSGAPKEKIQVQSISPGGAQLTVRHLVSVRQTQNMTIYKTPAFSLADARHELDTYWFGPMITLDGASCSLTVRFPDGKTVSYQDITSVPSFEHAVPRA